MSVFLILARCCRVITFLTQNPLFNTTTYSYLQETLLPNTHSNTAWRKFTLKKRLLSIALCAILLATPFAMSGCSRNVLRGDPDAPIARTVVMAMVCQDTDQEVLQEVVDRMNHTFENLIDTRLHIIVFSPEEYIEKVGTRSVAQYVYEEARPFSPFPDFEEMDFDRENPPTGVSRRANGDLVYVDATGRQRRLFPAVRENQIDIVFINGAETYNALKFGGFTADVYDEFGEPFVASNVEGDLVTPTLMPLNDLLRIRTDLARYVNTAMQQRVNTVSVPNTRGSNDTFAIPNNFIPENAEYHLMLVNRELMNQFQYDINLVNSLLDLEFFLEDVAQNVPDVIPVYNYLGYSWFVPDNRQGTFPLVTFPMSLANIGDRRVAGPSPANNYNQMNPRSSFQTASYRNTLNLLRNMELASGHRAEYVEVDIDQNFAVGFVRGDNAVRREFEEDFYVVTLSPPIIDSSMYDSMFAISYSAPDHQAIRALQVIEALSTDAELVNLFAYGIEGIHYTLDDNGVVTDRRGGYNMNPRFAGNNFLLMQNENMSERMLYYSANNWHEATRMAQSFVTSPFAGFEIVDQGYVNVRDNGQTTDGAAPMTLEELYQGLNDFSASVYQRLADFDEASSGMTFIEYLETVITPYVFENIYVSIYTRRPMYVNSPTAQYNRYVLRSFQHAPDG